MVENGALLDINLCRIKLHGYMLCCFKKYASTSVICKVVPKVVNGQVKFNLKIFKLIRFMIFNL